MDNQIQQEASWLQDECNIVGTYDSYSVLFHSVSPRCFKELSLRVRHAGQGGGDA